MLSEGETRGNEMLLLTYANLSSYPQWGRGFFSNSFINKGKGGFLCDVWRMAIKDLKSHTCTRHSGSSLRTP